MCLWHLMHHCKLYCRWITFAHAKWKPFPKRCCYCFCQRRKSDKSLRTSDFADDRLHRQSNSYFEHCLQSGIGCGDGGRRYLGRRICEAFLKIWTTLRESMQHCSDCPSCSPVLQRLARSAPAHLRDLDYFQPSFYRDCGQHTVLVFCSQPSTLSGPCFAAIAVP